MDGRLLLAWIAMLLGFAAPARTEDSVLADQIVVARDGGSRGRRLRDHAGDLDGRPARGLGMRLHPGRWRVAVIASGGTARRAFTVRGG